MHQLTTITRTNTGQLPESLALLAAPVIGDAASPETEPLGQVEGAIVDEAGRVAFFVVRGMQHWMLTKKRVLMPLASVSIEEAKQPAPTKLILRTSWTRDQVMAQPDFAEDYQLPTNRTDRSPVVSGRWAPAVPNVIPPGPGYNSAKAMRMRLLWGIPSALVGLFIGAILGYLTGSAYAVVATALFFGLAGGLAGSIAGATRDTAVDAGELHAQNPMTTGSSAAVIDNAGTSGLPYVQELEQVLNDRSFISMGILKATMILPTMQKVRETEGMQTPSILEASKPLRT